MLPHITQYMKTQLTNRSPGINTHYIWVGDFNCYHPLWDKPRNNHLFTKANLELAQPLLNLLGRFNMKMALPPLIPTLCAHSTGNHMRVNSVFCDKILYEVITICNTDEESRPIKSDHFPIVTQSNFLMVKSINRPRYNFRDTKWTDFNKTLSNNFNDLPPPSTITSIAAFDNRLNKINGAVQDMINKHVKISMPCPYSKRWWSKDLAEWKKVTHQLGTSSKCQRQNPGHHVHEAYHIMQNQYAEGMHRAKADYRVEWLEGEYSQILTRKNNAITCG